MEMNMDRRQALKRGASMVLAGGAAVVLAGGLAGCATSTNPTTGQVTYGLDPTVVTFIQDAVAAVAKYTPAIESIAATAASLFGPAYTAVVAAGSAAVNTVIATLENLVPSLPVGAERVHAKFRVMATPPLGGKFAGYTKQGVPVFGI
jgi:preprotein translocase subunit YajC